MILGIIGGGIGLPSAFCAGACGAVMGAAAEASQEDTNTMAQTLMYVALIGAVIGIIGGIMGKKNPVLSGILLLLAMFMAGATVIVGNMLALAVSILFLIAAVIAFTQKKETVGTVA